MTEDNAREGLRNALSSVIQLVVSTACIWVLYKLVLVQLGPEKFGVWSLVISVTSVVGLSNMGLAGSLTKHVAEATAQGNQIHAARIVETIALSVGVVALLIGALAIPLIQGYFRVTLQPVTRALALSIVPYAILAFVLSIVTGIYQSALYANRGIIIRNRLLIIDSVGYVLIALALSRKYGLVGLIIGRACQNAISLALSVLFLRRLLPTVNWIPTKWRMAVLKDLSGYAAGFQAIGVLALLTDPVTKGLLSRFGSLEMVTYYEMSSRLIGQARAVLVNANQVFVPLFARLNAATDKGVDVPFLRIHEASTLASLGCFGLLIVAMPLVSLFWIGHEQALFITFGEVLCAGWLINTMALPAYFASLGLGRIRTLLFAHLAMAGLNVILGVSLGRSFGGVGIVSAWAASLAVGGILMHRQFVRQQSYSVSQLYPRRLIAVILGTVAALLVAQLTTAGLHQSFKYGAQCSASGGHCNSLMIVDGAAVALYMAIFLASALSNAQFRELCAQLLPRRPRA